VHLRGYQAARKVDNGVIGVVENFRSVEALLLYVEKQCERAEQVVVVYEAGPLGLTLYRMLKARGVLCNVCAPDSTEQQRKRRKNNKIDARNLTSKLFNYLNGDQRGLQLARVPTEAQEQLRLASRQHDQLVEKRKRLGAKGNAMLLSQGFGSWSNWCTIIIFMDRRADDEKSIDSRSVPARRGMPAGVNRGGPRGPSGGRSPGRLPQPIRRCAMGQANIRARWRRCR
jgi:Transposase